MFKHRIVKRNISKIRNCKPGPFPRIPKQMLATAPIVVPQMKKNLFNSGLANRGKKALKMRVEKSKQLLIAPTRNSLSPLYSSASFGKKGASWE